MTFEQEVEVDQRALIEQLRSYVENREQREVYGKQVERLAVLFKNYLERHDGEELVDGERNIIARLQIRGGGDAYDIQRAPEGLVLLLHKLNLLTVNMAGVKAQEGREASERLKPYKVPGKGTVALIVEQK